MPIPIDLGLHDPITGMSFGGYIDAIRRTTDYQGREIPDNGNFRFGRVRDFRGGRAQQDRIREQRNGD